MPKPKLPAGRVFEAELASSEKLNRSLSVAGSVTSHLLIVQQLHVYSRVTSFPLFLRGLGAARVVGDPSRGKPVKLV
jgi:hypothetical protein